MPPAPPDINAPATTPGFYLRMFCVPLIWGLAFVPGKYAVESLPPGVAAFSRYTVACLTLLGAAHLFEGGLARPRGRQWLGLALLGLTGIAAYNLLMFKSLALIPGSRTAMIVALSPAFIAAGAALFLREPMGPRRWMGVALALAGAWVVLSHGEPARLLAGIGAGEGYMLAASLSWTAYTLLSRRVLGQGLSIIATTAWSSLLGTLMLAPVAFHDAFVSPGLGPKAHTPAPWLAVAAMGFFGTGVAFLWYADGIRKIGPALAAVFTNLVPVFAVLGTWLFLREEISWSLLVGGAITLAGVALVNGWKRGALATPLPTE